MLYSDNLAVQDLHKSHGEYKSFEYMAVVIICTAPVHVAIVYRPPCVPVSDFLIDFEDLLGKLELSTGKPLIIGDFSIHLERVGLYQMLLTSKTSLNVMTLYSM